MLLKMLLVSPEYFERLRRRADDDVDMDVNNERRNMHSLLKKKNAHPYDRWVKLRELQDPLLRRAQKKRRPLSLAIYETEAIRPRHVDTGIQTYDDDDDDDDDDGPDFADDYVMSEDEEIAQFGETHFGRIVTRYLSQYVRGDRSIDTVYGIRRETNGTFMIGDSPLKVDENGDVSVLGVTYEGTEGLWELLTETNVNQSLFTPYDMRSYKSILESTKGI
jgi:hypothetical protein